MGSAGGFVSVGSHVCWAGLGLLVMWLSGLTVRQQSVPAAALLLRQQLAGSAVFVVVVALSSSVAVCSVWMAALPTMCHAAIRSNGRKVLTKVCVWLPGRHTCTQCG